jgi:hypothetical protein
MSNEKRALLLLSSGIRPRYRHDILRALALPTGAQLQFRYQRKYLREDLFEKLTRNQVHGHKILVGYLDASDKGRIPTIVPCRMGTVSDSRTEGDFALIRFKVDEFAHSSDIAGLEKKLRDSLGEARYPYWEEGNCKGHFCIELSTLPSEITASPELTTWQLIVKQIGASSDFEEEPFFYSVRRLRKLSDDRETSLSDSKYVVAASSIYRLEIAHFSPNSPDAKLNRDVSNTSSLNVTLEGPGLQALAGMRIVVDSPYDVKEVSFRTDGESRRLHALMSLSRQTRISAEGKSLLQDTLDFEIAVEVEGSWIKPISIAFLIGISLAAQQGVPLFKANQLDVTSGVILTVLGVVIGLLVVFGVKKAP